MNIPQLLLSIVLFLLSLFLIAVVLLQEGKTAGLNGAISGGADTFLSKNKAKSLDAKLARWTKWVAIVFMVVCLVLALV
ncbi:preprotein translocase subunit SecG [Vermiculatibacterium agrestimuris]|jgi:preprotein translocase subunit SecG|uniref:preprotein translocase subunit SecG n=1 Tax=Vermiculatibacterium agrestimuris TaxID=2941519 RepID=UPI00203EDCEE|nr:preprotein translocase subunit SecG [Vermiculatibacterium agrestimuris]